MKNKFKFVLGDIQGCYQELRQLLKQIGYKRNNDIFCVGDIVNRGPESDKVVDFVLKNKVKSVLGNHDLHMMALILDIGKSKDKNHTLQKIIDKKTKLDILDYFLNFPFAKIIQNNMKKTLVVHAGVLPSWGVKDILAANEELTYSLKKDPEEFLRSMYSDRSKKISKSTNKRNRRRYLVNVFTRMRFISNNYKLDLKTKMNKTQIKKYKPWFKYRHKSLNELDGIVFGHWAAIRGVTNHTSIKGIDLGCVWGGSLGAYNIYDKSIITVKSKK